MRFHAPTGAMTIEKDGLVMAADHFRYALQQVRVLAVLPMDRYVKPTGPLTAADFAQRAIIEAADAMHIDLGVTASRWFDLDLRDKA